MLRVKLKVGYPLPFVSPSNGFALTSRPGPPLFVATQPNAHPWPAKEQYTPPAPKTWTPSPSAGPSYTATSHSAKPKKRPSWRLVWRKRWKGWRWICLRWVFSVSLFLPSLDVIISLFSRFLSVLSYTRERNER